MLKRIFFSAVFCSILNYSHAQIKPRMFEIGPKVGANLSGMANFDTLSLDKKLGLNYQIGLFTRLNFGKFSIQPELLYQTKGGTTKTPQAKYALKYISTPILFGFTPIKGIYLETGPEFNWTVNKDYKKLNQTIYGPNTSTDNSWVVGTRINMLDMFSLVSLNIRFTQGFNDFTTQKVGNTELDLRNRSLQVSFTYTFSEYYIWKKKYGIKKKK